MVQCFFLKEMCGSDCSKTEASIISKKKYLCDVVTSQSRFLAFSTWFITSEANIFQFQQMGPYHS
jgi:hypothetical protein